MRICLRTLSIDIGAGCIRWECGAGARAGGRGEVSETAGKQGEASETAWSLKWAYLGHDMISFVSFLYIA